MGIKIRGLAIALAAILALAGVAHAAGLYCFNLKNCAGAAGCYLGGSVDGCKITCIGGGSAQCEVIVP